jgi:histone H3/H4
MTPKAQKTPSAASRGKKQKPTKATPSPMGDTPLTYPVIKYSRILNDMKLYAKAHGGRASREAAHALAAALEYLGADVIERAAECSSRDEKSNGRISRRHLITSINTDDELVRIFVIPAEAMKSLKPKRVLHVVGQPKLKRRHHKKIAAALLEAEAPVSEKAPAEPKVKKTPKVKST